MIYINIYLYIYIYIYIHIYVYEIKPYLYDIINDHKTQGELKIQLEINEFFFKVF